MPGMKNDAGEMPWEALIPLQPAPSKMSSAGVAALRKTFQCIFT
jgi:hypothetical protein